MKKIGLIGGIGWRSSEIYYRLVNEEVGRRLGGLRSARLTLESLDFAEIRSRVDARNEIELREIYLQATQALLISGAEVLALCSNAAHVRIDYLQEVTSARFVHIAEPLVDAIKAKNMKRVILLGTKETMEGDFLKSPLRTGGAQIDVPDKSDRDWIHRMIFDDLERGTASVAQKKRLVEIVSAHAMSGAEAVILGCTELPLVISSSDVPIPSMDTTRMHAAAIVDAALTLVKKT